MRISWVYLRYDNREDMKVPVVFTTSSLSWHLKSWDKSVRAHRKSEVPDVMGRI